MAITRLAFGLLALVAMALGIPSYYYPDSWTYQDIQEFLASEDARNAIRPRQEFTFNTDNQGMGMVSGVGMDSQGRVFAFHRADRPWVAETFQENSNDLTEQYRIPIKKDTIFILDPNTGRNISSFGSNLFNVPHGLTIDKEDNVWVTDVGRHQVLRIPKGSTSPDLTVGTIFESGHDDQHFCKPTDVAVGSNGDFFVADGYCNSRVMKFSKDGTLITKWGTATNQRQDTADGPDPFNLAIPHSILLVEDLDIVCVADREHERALCYNAGLNSKRPVGAFNRTLIPEREMGKVFAIHYNEADKNVVAATEISRVPVMDNEGMWSFPARAYTYGLDGKEEVEWAYITPSIAENGPSLIHDLCSSKDGKAFFLGDIIQRKVVKYSLRTHAYVG